MLQSSPCESDARNQWPRAAHSGLMHCTVHPGKYCTLILPLELRAIFSVRGEPLRMLRTSHPRKKLRGFCAAEIVVSRKKIQYLVVWLQTDPHRGGGNLLSSFTTISGLPTICAFDMRNEMTRRFPVGKRTWCAIIFGFFLLAAAPAVQAQQQPAEGRDPDAPSAPQPAGRSAMPADQNKSAETPAAANPLMSGQHGFWDRKNDWLFAGVGAGRALDYASTLNLRRRGINEIFLTNSIVDNHPLFAGIEVAATAASIGVSYVFHRTGHHRLERWTSAIHAGVAMGGAIRNYALKTPHPN